MGLGEMFLDQQAEKVFQHYLVCVFRYLNMRTPNPRNPKLVLESFRRKVEEGCGVSEQEADDFRRMIAAFFGHLDLQNKPFTYDSNPKLKKGILEFVANYPDEVVPEYANWMSGKQGKYRSIDAPWEAS